MNPYLGAVVLVNVNAAHNGGGPVAPGVITRLNEDGTVNVAVVYDADPAGFLHHRPATVTSAVFHDTTDPAVANKAGLYGAFWPASTIQAEIDELMADQEKLMSEQADFQADVAALGSFLTGLTAQLTAIQAALANQGVTNVGPLDALVAQANALAPALAALPGGAPAAAPAPASGTAAAPVAEIGRAHV